MPDLLMKTTRNRCNSAFFSTIRFPMLATLACLLGAPLIVGAATIVDATRTITSISVRNDHAVIYYAPAFPKAADGEGCAGVNASLAVVIDWSAVSDNRNLFVAALAAFHAGSRVGFVVDSCSVDGLPLAVQINVEP